MLKHCVFVNFQDDIDQATRARVLASFGQLQSEVEGMIDYSHGPNRDFENQSADYDGGFVITFTDRAAHLAYETHPTHVRLGGEMVAMCKGGMDGIMVFDLEVG